MEYKTLYQLDDEEPFEVFSTIINTFDTPPQFIYQYSDALLSMDRDIIIRGMDRIVSPYIIKLQEEFPNLWKEKLSYMWEVKYGVKWDRMWNALITEYKPLDNYAMLEKTTPNTAITSTTTSNGENDICAFNSSTESPSTKASLTNTSTSTTSGTITLERSGNIGVTTSAQMLTQEMDVRIKNIMYDYIVEDVLRELTLSIY